jgi:hypothetical protein
MRTLRTKGLVNDPMSFICFFAGVILGLKGDYSIVTSSLCRRIGGNMHQCLGIDRT